MTSPDVRVRRQARLLKPRVRSRPAGAARRGRRTRPDDERGHRAGPARRPSAGCGRPCGSHRSRRLAERPQADCRAAPTPARTGARPRARACPFPATGEPTRPRSEPRRPRPGPPRSQAAVASSESARTSQTSSPAAGTTLNAPPECMTVGTAVRCPSPSGSFAAAIRRATSPSASRALRPFSGDEPAWAATPCAPGRGSSPRPCAWRPAPPPRRRRTERPRSKDMHPSRRSAGPWRKPPVRHSSSTTVSRPTSANVSGDRGERTHHPEREHVAALHVDAARAGQPAVGALERAVIVVGDDRVEMPEEQHAARAGALSS